MQMSPGATLLPGCIGRVSTGNIAVYDLLWNEFGLASTSRDTLYTAAQYSGSHRSNAWSSLGVYKENTRAWLCAAYRCLPSPAACIWSDSKYGRAYIALPSRGHEYVQHNARNWSEEAYSQSTRRKPRQETGPTSGKALLDEIFNTKRIEQRLDKMGESLSYLRLRRWNLGPNGEA